MITVHVLHDDHISGFSMTEKQASCVCNLSTNEGINWYLIKICKRIEINEADASLDMTDPSNGSVREFKTELSDHYIT